MRSISAISLVPRAYDDLSRLDPDVTGVVDRYRMLAQRTDVWQMPDVAAGLVVRRAVEVAQEAVVLRLVRELAVHVHAPARERPETARVTHEEEVAVAERRHRRDREGLRRAAVVA